MNDTAAVCTTPLCTLLRQASTSSFWVCILFAALVVGSWMAATRSARIINQYQTKLSDATPDAQHLTAHSRFS